MSPRLVLLLVAVLVLDGAAGVALGWRLNGAGSSADGEGSSWAAPGGLAATDRATMRARAVENLLDTRARALTNRDRAAYLATVDPTRPRVRRRQAVLFDRMSGLPVQSWDLELKGAVQPASRRGPTSGSAGTDGWVADVSVRHRLRGFDTGWASRQVALTLTRRQSRWYVAGERALSQERAEGVHTAVVDRSSMPAKDLWQLGATRVVRGERSLVVGAASRASLSRVARGADEQVRTVSGFWGEGWARQVVVLVPGTVGDMASLLGADPRGLRQIAAVTTGETDPATGGSASRIVLNPHAFRALAPVGRKIVLAHEVTHVAARRATTAHVPTWLAEGFADYVAYRRTGLARAAVAEELFDDVRAGRVPVRLPVSADFLGTEHRLAQHYEMAWLACVFVADRYGEQTLLNLYRESGRSGLPKALRGILGLSEPAFTAKWRAFLVRNAG